MLFAILFTIGSILVTWLLYLALRPRTLEVESEAADLRYIGMALILIILTATTVAAMLILGKLDKVNISF
ncbi:MAG: hypothetical protein ACK40N_02805 [Meiothermus ruber]|uniref:Cytochrome oxidase Caa3-type subunit IV domain-containing protein n=1 Tax=Meiothermus ruber TaxID=277 RepID=A0A7C3HTR6_MEIRU|nr:hypothetical protein [Meiothermus sp.]MCX8087884.1 hypothetical protein [Meiothermus ruber]GIW27967.1 MAG: hypothetical protein KatS3mg070_1330 [Meiothermus sp.]